MRDGIIVVWKEPGYTSHDVVACLRGILHIKKIGHTGTLDPMAEGVLPAAVGKGTGLVEYLTEKKKTYETVLHLGIVTDTQDASGNILAERAVNVTEEQLGEAVRSFIGERMQIPPMYSALKVNGKKLYELAREGKTVERKARPVTFYDIEVTGITLPLVSMRVTCSKGTYIRTLCHDIGETLGCGGMMESLVRTASGQFTKEQALTLEQIRDAVAEGKEDDTIIPVEEVLSEYPKAFADTVTDPLLKNGNPLGEHLVHPDREPGADRKVRMYLSDGTFAGLYVYEPNRKRYKPSKMFLSL